MKKEDLLKVFPSLNEMEIQTLPNELVICWYPSSGVGADLNDNFCGYVAMRHWQEQPCKLKPNFFIFSDIVDFDVPAGAEVLFEEKLLPTNHILDFLNNPIEINYNLLSHKLKSTSRILLDDIERLLELGLIDELDFIKEFENADFLDDLERLFELGMIDELDLITEFENADSVNDKEFKKLEIKLLIEKGIFEKQKLIDRFKEIDINNLMDVIIGPFKSIILINLNNFFFLLVQGRNESIYERFIDENIKIPLLTLNRPMDPFIFDNGIDIEKLGIEEFIAGHSYVSSLIFGEEFKKYPDFVFGTIRREQVEHHDLANLYARLI